MAISRQVVAWLGSARNTAGCAAGLGGIVLGATGVIPAPYWPLATAALYAAGALAVPTRQPPHPAVTSPPAIGTAQPQTTGAGAAAPQAGAGAAAPQAGQHAAGSSVTGARPAGSTADTGTRGADRSQPPAGAQWDTGSWAAVRAALDAQITRLARRSVPVEPVVVSAVHDLAEAVREFLDDPGLTDSSHGPTDRAGRTIERTVRDHLPGVLDEYLALPRLYATLHRRPDGRTPHQAVLDQLTVLAAVIHAVTAAAWRGDEAAVRVQEERLAADPLFDRGDLSSGGGPAPAGD